ncbi:hypothetical protein GcM3_088004 [Golovinomyces cichoracearum]|uniref:Uncharacterized protein n=1 Tax=Golovinomyces cichoracearum TaxID=62708 RepID=A0A420IJP7_9PEZI|nr:hypothetical protein GcM3_088004 [Golovinomyces cichoracearum]
MKIKETGYSLRKKSELQLSKCAHEKVRSKLRVLQTLQRLSLRIDLTSEFHLEYYKTTQHET